MREYANACWKTCEKLHLLMLDDDQPENEKQRLDPDHWYEINLTNAVLFANLSLDGLPQLAPGRLFTTRQSYNYHVLLMENSILKIFGSVDVKITPDFCS